MAKQRKLRRRIAVATKLEIIDQLPFVPSRQLAKQYGVSRSNVMEWKRKEPELRAMRRSACRLPGAGAKIVGPELHQELTEKVLFERSEQRRVTRGMIALWANEMKAAMNLVISVCPSWIDRFLARGGFVLRKGTRKPVLEDYQIIERGALFIAQVRDIITKHSVQPSNIYNLDETAVFFDHSKSTTVHTRGSQDVPIQSFGFEKQRVTAVFCASATGEKKLPCAMVKSRSIAGQDLVAVDNGVVELRMGTSWMNAASFIQYIQHLFPEPLAPNSTLLIFDSARCHTARDVQEYLNQRAILYVVIPGGMTGFCQPADFGWFAQLKTQLSKSIDKWKHVGQHELTRSGRVKPPSRLVVASWLTEAWAVVRPSTIRVSFARCALGGNEELCLSRHERLGSRFQQRMQERESAHVDTLQDISDEFDDLLVVDDI